MAINFNDANGSAIKGAEAYKFKDDENVVRMVGPILARYIYWIKAGGKQLPVECLAFNRQTEKFDNKEVDHVPKYFPDLKCSWAYAVNCIDPADGKVKVLNLKKKLFLQIVDAAKDGLGDPTDPETGWDIVFRKKKTGAMAFNVEYNLSQLKLKKRPLTDAERSAVAEAGSIDEKVPRQTPAQVEALLKRSTSGDDDGDGMDDAAKEAANDL